MFLKSKLKGNKLYYNNLDANDEKKHKNKINK
jgi:hypothetical protein